MNDHGLGPVIGPFTFGHGGTDEEFRASLTAWKETSNALVIMVNTDNGSIIDEVKLALTKEYNLPGIETKIKKVVQIPKGKLNKFVGKYLIDELGELDILNLSNHLGIVGEFLGDTLRIKAESDTVFFDVDDGTQFTFKIEVDAVTGFSVDRFSAKREQ